MHNPTQPLPPHHLQSPLSECDLVELGHLLPPSAQTLVRTVGVPAALALLNHWPGVQLPVPKHPRANTHGADRWQKISAVIGQPAMQKLAAYAGGSMLDIPLLDTLRRERRNTALRQQFDALTARGTDGKTLSKNAAVIELCLRFCPITYRQIETILDNAAPQPNPSQTPLF